MRALRTYDTAAQITPGTAERKIFCRVCGGASDDPRDIAGRYCPRCNTYHARAGETLAMVRRWRTLAIDGYACTAAGLCLAAVAMRMGHSPLDWVLAILNIVFALCNYYTAWRCWERWHKLGGLWRRINEVRISRGQST